MSERSIIRSIKIQRVSRFKCCFTILGGSNGASNIQSLKIGLNGKLSEYSKVRTVSFNRTFFILEQFPDSKTSFDWLYFLEHRLENRLKNRLDSQADYRITLARCSILNQFDKYRSLIPRCMTESLLNIMLSFVNLRASQQPSMPRTCWFTF